MKLKPFFNLGDKVDRCWAIPCGAGLLAYGLNLAARVFAEQHPYRKGELK